MNLSKANAGSLVRAVIDAVALTADDQDVAAADWSEALALLEATAARNNETERAALLDIVSVLRTLRAAV